MHKWQFWNFLCFPSNILYCGFCLLTAKFRISWFYDMLLLKSFLAGGKFFFQWKSKLILWIHIFKNTLIGNIEFDEGKSYFFTLFSCTSYLEWNGDLTFLRAFLERIVQRCQYRSTRHCRLVLLKKVKIPEVHSSNKMNCLVETVVLKTFNK